MNIDTSLDAFYEIVGLRLPVKLAHYEPDDPADRERSFQIEIETPLKPGTRVGVDAVIKRYNLNAMRKPARHTYSGKKGKLILL